jgi:hypothetical protein
MTKVIIFHEPFEGGKSRYRAIAGNRQSVGATPGEALDAISAKLPADRAGTLVVVQNFGGDEFFTDDQHRRLQSLMLRWRAARDNGASLPEEDQIELESLVTAELEAAGLRCSLERKE